MDQYAVFVTVRAAPDSAPVLVTPRLLTALGLAEDQLCLLRCGLRQVRAYFRSDPALDPGHLNLPSDLAVQLALEQPPGFTIWSPQPGVVALGPVIGLLVARAKLAAILGGEEDTVYHRYARYAGEVGAVLCFFKADDLDADLVTVRGFQLQRCAGRWQWVARRLPAPRVVYDRCFGKQAQNEAAHLRRMAQALQITVVNFPIKITKLDTFTALGGYPELAPYLPFTAPLTHASLAAALEAYPDLYLKPNALYKGRGVYRLLRRSGGWLLESRGEEGNVIRLLAGPSEVAAAMADHLDSGDYVLQEGLALATYLGNRFDFRSLVQKDGRGEWGVTGLVARIAPVDSVITSPRSGGEVAPADRVLRHAFPTRWPAVLAALKQASIEIARRVDQELGPCADLGLDVGVVADGSVKLIEVNGKPLKVSLERLGDPLTMERIYRYPIHYAAHLDLAGAQGVIR